MEKRGNKRYPRRYKVRFGEKLPTHTGITADVSVGGVFIVTNQPPLPGTRMSVELTLDDERLLRFEAVSARQTIVPPELRAIRKGGFGVRFLSYRELLVEMVPALKDKTGRMVLTYATRESFKLAWDKDLSKGGTFVVLEKEYPPNTLLTLEIELPFIYQHHDFEMKVMNVFPQADRKFGTVLMFADPADAARALAAAINAPP